MASPVVRLIGGPMDGWLVKPDAPALNSNWNEDGCYVTSDPDEYGTLQATWDLESESE